MEPDDRPRALPEVEDVLKRHGHSGGVGLPGPARGPGQASGPQDTRRAQDRPAEAGRAPEAGRPAEPATPAQPADPQPPAPPSSAETDTAARRVRRGLRRRGIVPIALLAAGGLWFGLGAFETSDGAMTDVPTHVILSLGEVENVRITGVAGDELRWSSRSRFPGGCDVLPGQIQGAALEVNVACRDPWIGDHDLEIDVPAGTRLTVQGGNTDVRVRGSVEAVSVTTDRGDVRFDKVTGDMAARTQRGDIRLDDVRGWIWAEAGSGDVRGDVRSARSVAVSAGGDVRLDYSGAVATTDVEASGDVALELDSDSARLDVQADGDVKNSVKDNPAASEAVRIRSHGGDVKLSR